MIPESFLEELKMNSDIEQVLSSYVLLKRAGRNLKGLCPFHSEKSPSFTVYPETQSYYCFGCGAGGDVISFIKRAENLEYVEAVKLLAEKSGMRMPEDVQSDDTGKKRLRILEMNRESARFFHAQLKSPMGQQALEYLLGRGMTKQMIIRFGVGYAPDSWDSLRNYLRGKGYSYEEITEAGLTVSRTSGSGYYDAFRNRVIFPIIDLRGNVVGFGGRALGNGTPKYLNSSDSLVFKKSRNLFALNFAKSTKENTLILAEGYMDVIAIYQAGFDNAVATLGTALTDEQARLISQYCSEVIIAYDSDGAGQNATRRAIKLLDETGIKIRVIKMEGAKDPDEYIKKFGATRFKLLLDGSANAVEYAIERLREKHDLESDDGKVRFLSDFALLISDISSPIERDVYMGRWAQTLGVSKDAIHEQVKSVEKRRKNAQRKKQSASMGIYSQEIEINKRDKQRSKYLKYALAEDKLIAALLKNNDYYKYIIERIIPEDVVTDSNRKIFAAITKHLSENRSAELISFSEELDDELISRMSWLLAESEGKRFDLAEVDDYIDRIKSFKLKKDDTQLAEMSSAEFDDYIRNLADKKRK